MKIRSSDMPLVNPYSGSRKGVFYACYTNSGRKTNKNKKRSSNSVISANKKKLLKTEKIEIVKMNNELEEGWKIWWVIKPLNSFWQFPS